MQTKAYFYDMLNELCINYVKISRFSKKVPANQICNYGPLTISQMNKVRAFTTAVVKNLVSELATEGGYWPIQTSHQDNKTY